VCDLETSRMGAPYIYDISRLRVKVHLHTVPHVPPGLLSVSSLQDFRLKPSRHFLYFPCILHAPKSSLPDLVTLIKNDGRSQ